ncbi:MAG TPA: cobalamin-dependent protein [Elusimicrobiota bacterium]|nr:cobalamin-dependent protein [Elusimicrobiota bacterium]
MKILLINPITRLNNYVSNLPLGIAYVAASLRQEGHDVRIFDLDAHKYGKEDVRKTLEKCDYDVLGMTGIITSFQQQRWIIDEAKRVNPATPVILGGVGVSSIPELFFQQTKVDVVVCGEGDIAIREVLARLSDKKGLADVPGIHYRQGGGVVKNPPRSVVRDPDTLPFPAWDLLPIEKYLCRPSPAWHKKNMTFLTARGCPYQCTFCQPTGGHLYRYRSIDNVIAEMKKAMGLYHYGHALLSDECWPIRRDRCFEFCEKVKPLNIEWSCTGRANLMDEPLVEAMADSGCVMVGMGYESASHIILKNIKKSQTAEHERKAIRLLQKYGIVPSTSYIAGLPGETPATLRETVDFIEDLDVPIFDFFFATPYPGTALYDYAVTRGKITDPLPLVESYEEMASNLLVNVTDMSDEELIRIKREAEVELREVYRRRHPLYFHLERLKGFYERLLARWRSGSLPKVFLHRLGRFLRKWGIADSDRLLRSGEYSWLSDKRV